MRRLLHTTRAAPGDAGMATAEFAVAMPALVLVLTLLTGVAQAVLLHHRALHAASLGARVAARGEPDAAVRTAILRTGLHADIAITRGGGYVTVGVTPAQPSVTDWALPDVSARAVGLIESSLP